MLVPHAHHALRQTRPSRPSLDGSRTRSLSLIKAVSTQSHHRMLRLTTIQILQHKPELHVQLERRGRRFQVFKRTIRRILITVLFLELDNGTATLFL